KPTKSKGFDKIVDFVNANLVKYALTVNPTIYTSCIQQFWDSAKVKTVNEDVQIRALVDGKKIIITEASIRCDLQLEDAEEKERRETEVPHTEPQTKESVPTTSNDPLPSGEDRMQLTKLMNLCTNLQKQVLDLEKAKTTQAKEIADLKKRVKKLEGKKKLRTSDKAKGIMVEPEKPLKKKDQIEFDEEVVRKLEAQMKAKMEEEERIARKKDEANIDVIEQWDEVQAKTNVDMELA
nr:xylulose kinase-1 [Tanacetum cinerariifolium]